MKKGSLVVNSSQRGGSKDTWVLAPGGQSMITPAPAAVEPRGQRRLLDGAATSSAPKTLARFLDVNHKPDARPARRLLEPSGSPSINTTGDRELFARSAMAKPRSRMWCASWHSMR